MIKKLRRKIIGITTVLLTLMLVVILGFLYYSTKVGMEQSSYNRLQSAASQLGQSMRPGNVGRWDSRYCFALHLMPDGELFAVGGDHYDLNNREELLSLLDEAKATGAKRGVLREHNLRFLQIEGGRDITYAFTDISAEHETLSRMNFTCAMILIVGMAGFFGVSVLVARWTVRPVEQAWEQQRQFVADASHELKTPLTVILTNAELLHGEEYDEESKKRFASSILTMSRQMRGLVEELLDQARVDTFKQREDHRKLDFSKLVADAVLPFEPVYFEAGRELRCEIEPNVSVCGQAEHLRRVVEILLDNGCKYSSAGGVVELRLQRQGKNSVLSVRSPGASMTPEQCRDIFKRFYRMDSARTMNRSYGLGLSIAQGIVTRHKGKIWAQSQNGFNTFFISLPQ